MADHLRLDPDGKLSADGEEGKKYISARAGRWRIVPTNPQMSLLVREGAATGAPMPKARCVLSGELGAIPPVDLAAFLHQQRLTGILWTLTSLVERSIWFKEGRVRWAASSSAAERLGEVAVKLGMITQAQLSEISREQTGAVRRLGQTLVDRGYINGHDLWKAIQHQITEVFYAFLMCRSGPFAFIDDAVEDRFAAHLSLDTQGLLMDGVQRLDEMAHFRRTVPETSYVRRKGPLKGEFGPLEQRIYDLADGERTVQEIARQMGVGEFDAVKAIFHLVEEKAVECVAGAEQAPKQVAAVGADAVAQAFNLIFRTIYDALKRAPAGTEGFDVAVNAYLASDSPHRDLFKDLRLDSFGTLDELALVANLSLQKDSAAQKNPARFLAVALDDLMYFMLFEAGECLPPADDEALGKKVKAARASIEI